MSRSYLSMTCAVVALSVSGGRAAQAQTAAAAPDQPAATLGEVIVTATRRETKLQETPIAITTFTGASLDQVDDISNIAALTPSTTFHAESRQEAYLSIRGTTKANSSPGSDQGTSVFIDGVPVIGVEGNDPNLFDLQSIEVLRGPQGTLFGKNVTGGALLINTLAPSFTFHDKAEFTYGNDSLLEGRAYVTGPLIDDVLAGKLTLDLRSQDGVMNAPYLGHNVDNTRLGGARAQILWTPISNFKVLAGADLTIDTSSYKNAQVFGNFQPALFPHLYYGPSQTDEAVDPIGDSRAGGGFARTDYILPWATFTTITGYRRVNSKEYYSTTADPLDENVQLNRVKSEQFTEEWHLASPQGQPLTWLAGLFYLNARRSGDRVYNYIVPPGVVANFQEPYSGPNKSFFKLDDQSVHSHDYAVFGDVSYAFTSQWKLDVSARYTVEDKSGHSEVSDTSGSPPDPANAYFPSVAATYSHTWTSFDPKIIATWTPNKIFLAYASFGTGFKSGGFDTSGSTSSDLAHPFLPERVKSYEVGAKLTALEGHLIFDIAAYDAQYTNLQVTEFNPVTFSQFTGNAGKSDIPGVEIETLVNATPWLTLSANYSHMDPTYKQYNLLNASGGYTNYAGNAIPFDVKNHLTLGAETHFTAAFLDGGEVRFGGDLSYQDKMYFQDDNAADWSYVHDHSAINGFLNLHLKWISRNKLWEASLWGKNVSNDRYITDAANIIGGYANLKEFINSPPNQIYLGDWNSPRTFGLTLTYKH